MDGPDRPFVDGRPGPGPSVPAPPPDAVWPPFLPIEQEQTEWTIVLLLLVVAPLVLRRRYPLAVLLVVLAVAPAVSTGYRPW